MSTSASFKQAIYSSYTKYTCLLDKKVSINLQKMMADWLSTTGAHFAPRLKINIAHAEGRNIHIWAIDTAVTSEKIPPLALQHVMRMMSHANVELIPCHDATWSRIVSTN